MNLSSCISLDDHRNRVRLFVHVPVSPVSDRLDGDGNAPRFSPLPLSRPSLAHRVPRAQLGVDDANLSTLLPGRRGDGALNS